MLCSFVTILIYSIIIPLLITHFGEEFISVVPDYDIRMKLIPTLSFCAIIDLLVTFIFLYVLLKIIYKNKVNIKEIFKEFVSKFTTSIVACEITYIIIKKFIKNVFILFVPELILAIFYVYCINSYLKKVDSQKIKRYITACIVGVLFLVLR